MRGLGDFLVKWFLGPVQSSNRNLVYLMSREMGICRDMADRSSFQREAVQADDLPGLVNELARVNVFLGVGFWLWTHSSKPERKWMLYDRVSYDFDSEKDPAEAVKAAVFFSRILEKEYGVTPVVYKSGFKGAHVVVPLSETTDWAGYELLWKHFYSLIPLEFKPLVDKNMLQWNRLERVPFTFNIRNGVKKLAAMITPVSKPEDFDWSLVKALNPGKVTVYVYKFESHKNYSASRSMFKDDWILKIVEKGLWDGRHRFVFHVLAPRCINVWGKSEEECKEIIQLFLENSCRYWSKCGGFSMSDVENYLRSAARRRFHGFTLNGLLKKDSELYEIIVEVLSSSYSSSEQENAFT